MEELPQWQWFKVTFDLGIPPGMELETDPALFFKWLLEPSTKYVDGLDVQPAVLRTAPFE